MKPNPLRALWPYAHRNLIGQLAARDIQARTRGSVLGMAWWVLTPLLMLLVYTLVLRHVLGVRWGGAAGAHAADGLGDLGDLGFALRLYAGLAVFAYCSDVLMRAPRLVADVPHLVKKVVFPLEVLPWVSALAGLVPLAVAGVLLLLGTALAQGALPLTAWALPVVWLPLLPWMLGLGWGLAAVGTYIRDVGDFLGLALGAVLFLSPVFYDANSLPPALQAPLSANPLAVVMTQTRGLLFSSQWPDWGAWWTVMGCGLLVAFLGAALFTRVRAGFADVV